jgi:hypothetical protein
MITDTLRRAGFPRWAGFTKAALISTGTAVLSGIAAFGVVREHGQRFIVGGALSIPLLLLPLPLAAAITTAGFPFATELVSNAALLLAGVLLILLARLGSHVLLRACALAAPFALFVFVQILATQHLPTRSGGAQIVALLLPVWFALFAYEVFDEGQDLAVIALSVLFIPSAIGIVQVAIGGVGARADGGLNTPSLLGLLGAMTVVGVVAGRALGTRTGTVAAMLGAIDVVTSGTRIAAVILFATLAIAAALAWRADRDLEARRVRRALVLMMVGALPLAGLIFRRLEEAILHGRGDFTSRATDTPLGSRSVIWHLLLDDYRGGSGIQKLIGHGAGQSTGVVGGRFGGNLNLPHDEFLRFLVDFGWIGVASLLAMLLLLLIWSRRFANGLAPLLFATTVGMASVTDNPLFYPQILLVPAAAVAVSLRESHSDHIE